MITGFLCARKCAVRYSGETLEIWETYIYPLSNILAAAYMIFQDMRLKEIQAYFEALNLLYDHCLMLITDQVWPSTELILATWRMGPTHHDKNRCYLVKKSQPNADWCFVWHTELCITSPFCTIWLQHLKFSSEWALKMTLSLCFWVCNASIIAAMDKQVYNVEHGSIEWVWQVWNECTSHPVRSLVLPGIYVYAIH